MPNLRFSRDRRGYESTFLVHTVQRRGRQQTRILYWFRSPPQVKVGRAAIDEDAIRDLEAQHPEIAFDWSRILEARPTFTEADTGGGDGRPREERSWRAGGPKMQAGPPGRPERRGSAPPEPRHGRATSPSPSVPAQATEWSGPALQPSAAQQVLGAEALARLRGLHAEALARISQHVQDPTAADELRSLAEALNPDAWVTVEDVRAGRAGFGRALGDLRMRMGLPPRRVRGGRKHRADPPSSSPSESGAAGARQDTGGAAAVPGKSSGGGGVEPGS